MMKLLKVIRCDICGREYKSDSMFIKQCQNAVISLCKKCAKDLHNELEQFDLGYNDTMSKGELTNWFIDSVSLNDEPVWTEKHIDELLGSFYVIPKDQQGDKIMKNKKYNGEVNIKLTISDGKINTVCFDNLSQKIIYDIKDYDKTAWYVEDITEFIEEYLENCCSNK